MEDKPPMNNCIVLMQGFESQSNREILDYPFFIDPYSHLYSDCYLIHEVVRELEKRCPISTIQIDHVDSKCALIEAGDKRIIMPLGVLTPQTICNVVSARMDASFLFFCKGKPAGKHKECLTQFSCAHNKMLLSFSLPKLENKLYYASRPHFEKIADFSENVLAGILASIIYESIIKPLIFG